MHIFLNLTYHLRKKNSFPKWPKIAQKIYTKPPNSGYGNKHRDLALLETWAWYWQKGRVKRRQNSLHVYLFDYTSPLPLNSTQPLPHPCCFRKTHFHEATSSTLSKVYFVFIIVLLSFSSSCTCSSLTADDLVVQDPVLSRVLGNAQSECL